jgi:hypothetical protein
MQTSKDIVLKSGLLPKLQLGIKTGGGVKSTGKHTVKVIEDKVIRKPPREEGDDGYYVRYIVEENGERKQYDTRMKQKGGVDPSYFVQAMANVEPGEQIILEMKKAGVKNYIEITRTSVGKVEHADADEDDQAEDDPRAREEGGDLAGELASIHA